MQIKNVEILLILLSTTITLVLGLLLIRWLQPSLLGVSKDMILVSSNEKVTPYYENIFRKEDFLSKEIILAMIKDDTLTSSGTFTGVSIESDMSTT